MTYKPKMSASGDPIGTPLYEPGVRYRPGLPAPAVFAGMTPAGKQGNCWPNSIALKGSHLWEDWEDIPALKISREDWHEDWPVRLYSKVSPCRLSHDSPNYHIAVTFPDGRVQDPSVPFAMGFKKDYVMAKELKLTTSTPEQLSEYTTTSMADRTRVHVTSLSCVFVLDKCSQALADGITVINTRMPGNGRWILESADDRPALSPRAAAIYESYVRSDPPQPRMTNITGAYQIVAPRGAIIGVSGPGAIEFIKKAISGTKGRGRSVLVVPTIDVSSGSNVSAIGSAELTVSSNVPNLWEVLQENKTANLAIVDDDLARIGNIAFTNKIRGLKDLRVAFIHHTGHQYLEQNVDIDIRCSGLSWTYAKHRYAKEGVNGVYFSI